MVLVTAAVVYPWTVVVHLHHTPKERSRGKSYARDTLAAKRLEAPRSATIGYDRLKAVHNRRAFPRAGHQAFQLQIFR